MSCLLMEVVMMKRGDHMDATTVLNSILSQALFDDFVPVAHPFVCLPALLENARPEWHAPLTRAYRESWRDIVSPAQLKPALRLARPRAALQMAFSYYDIPHAGEP